MMEYNGGGLCFDDILLVPQHSEVESRKAVNLTMNIGRHVYLSLPVISSPMDTVTESDMAIAMAEAGGLGIIHRYNSISTQCKLVNAVYDEYGYGVGAAVGATGDYRERAEQLVGSGAGIILVDIANGHSQMAIEAVANLRSDLGEEIHIMAGNVATQAGYTALSLAGADSVRVGIGGGAVCTTRLVSGHGVPTLASIQEVSRHRDSCASQGVSLAKIIADGGIRNTGDMVKAFAAGADAVMVGSMLAGTDETPGVAWDGKKVYRGMASENAYRDFTGNSPTVSEGVSTTVEVRGPVARVLQEIRTGIGSGCSYSGVYALRDLQDYARYVRVSGNTLNESRPHGRL